MAGGMITERHHTATLLNDGTVVFAVGDTLSGSTFNGVSTPELFDPTSGTFSPTGSMGTDRTFHTATLLNDGKGLIAGGGNYVAELYDPATGTFSLTGSMLASRSSHAAALLANGQVVVTGSSGPVFRFQGQCHAVLAASAEPYH